MPQTADEQEAIKRIQACLESGEKMLDLGGYNLDKIPENLPLCIHLKILGLEYFGQIGDFSGLETLTNLESLYIWSSNIKNIEWLKNMTKLKYLVLSSSKNLDTKTFPVLENLYQLDIGYRDVLNLSDLYKFRKCLFFT